MPSDAAEAVSTFTAELTAEALYRGRVALVIAKRRTARLVTTPDRVRLQRALQTLASEHGYIVTDERDSLACCNNCAWHAVPDDAPGAVLWCIQGDGYAFDGDAGFCGDDYSDWLRHTLHLQWAGNGRLIAKTLRDAGFQVRWDGRRKTAIAVLPSVEHADPACQKLECRPLRLRRTHRRTPLGSDAAERTSVSMNVTQTTLGPVAS